MYDFVHSLGFGSDTIVSMLDDSNLAVKFSATEELPKGAIVKITGDGAVGIVTAPADVPIGVVVTSAEINGAWTCVVQTPFQAIVVGIASGNLAAAADVSADSLDAPTNKMVYIAAGANPVAGIVLKGALDTEDVIVGVKRVF